MIVVLPYRHRIMKLYRLLEVNMKHSLSHLQVCSVGIVAKDKEKDSQEILVVPLEFIPLFSGEITTAIDNQTVEQENYFGETYTVTLNRGMFVKAIWLGDTNRVTPPDVCKNEQVKLYSIGNSERYYWEPMGRDDQLRRTETIVHRVAASGAGKDEDIRLTQDNSYTVTIDTFDQHITLKTSTDNGEYTGYTLQFNTREGNVTLLDGEGNVIQLDSANTKITILNKEGTFLEASGRNLQFHAPEDIIFTSGRDVQWNVGGNWSSNIAGSTTWTSPEVTVSGTITLDGPVTITGETTLQSSITGNEGTFTNLNYNTWNNTPQSDHLA